MTNCWNAAALAATKAVKRPIGRQRPFQAKELLMRTPCRCSIIPPHILNHLLSHKDAGVRQSAFSTLLTNRAMSEQRRFFSIASPTSLATGGCRRTIYDAQNTSTLPGKYVRGEGDAATSDAAVGEAYDGAGVTYDFYDEVFARKSIDGNGMRIDSTVHYQEDPTEGYDNAFWNGRQMVYGDGDRTVFTSFTRSLDVIAHELTHGVTQFEAGLEYHDQPGALNESFSDVFGSMVKQWKSNQTVSSADWLIGRELLVDQSGGRALRSMKAPGTAYMNDPDLGDDPQPDRMSRYLMLANSPAGDNGGVHINSGIPNRAFYLACVNLGDSYSWNRAGKIWYATLRSLHATSEFLDAANATVHFAQQMFGSAAAAAVRQAWQQVEVLQTLAVSVSLPIGAVNPRGVAAPVPPAPPANGGPGPA